VCVDGPGVGSLFDGLAMVVAVVYPLWIDWS